MTDVLTFALQTETVVLTKTAKQKLKDGEVPVVVHKRPTPCPPCNTMVRRACVGAHVVRALRCPNNARFSCRQPCGRVSEYSD